MAPSAAPEVTNEFLAQSQQPNIYAAAIIPFILSCSAVVARFWCRWIKKAGYKVDDVLIVLALVALTGLVVDALWSIVSLSLDLSTANFPSVLPNGLGRHIQLAGPDAVYNFWLGWFIGEATYTGVIIFVKFSILALYWRTFSPLGIKREIVFMSVVTFLWGAAVYICMLLHCEPLNKYWDPNVPGQCNLNNQAYFFAISIPNILIDVTLLALPVRYILKLEMGRRQKQAVASLFLFGGFVCIASILRLVSVVTSNVADPDSTWVNVGQCVWAIVECNAAVTTACLPCLGPIFSYFWPSAFAPRRRLSGQPPVEWTIGSEPRKKFSDRSKDPYTDTLLLTRTDDQQSTIDTPDGCIKVKNEWTVEADRASNSRTSHHEMPWASKV